MQILSSADLTGDDDSDSPGIGVHIAPDGTVQYVQHSIIDTAQVLLVASVRYCSGGIGVHMVP